MAQQGMGAGGWGEYLFQYLRKIRRNDNLIGTKDAVDVHRGRV